MTTVRHRTPSEQRAHAAGLAAVARAQTRATTSPTPPEPGPLDRLIAARRDELPLNLTPARARQIRLEAEGDRNA